MLMNKGSSFELFIPRCDVLKDITHDYSGQEIITLRIRAQKSAMNKYTYKPESGLRLEETIVDYSDPNMEDFEEATPGKKIEPDVLLALCSVYDCDSLINFIKHYGFFFELPDQNYYFSVSYVSLNSLLENFKNALMLFQETMYAGPNIKRMITLVYELMMYPQKSITLPNTTYRSGEHPFAKIWNDRDYAKQYIYLDESFADMGFTSLDGSEAYPTPIYTAYDTFSNSYVHVQPTAYLEKRYQPGSNLLYHLHMLYASIPVSMVSSRYMIDLLYHLYQDNALEFIENKFDSFLLNLKDFKCDSNQKNAYEELLKKLACYILKEEIDFNSCAADLQFDPDQQAAHFYVPTLWCALHISLIDFKARQHVYRKCAKCPKYFVQKKTTTNKKYCSSTCRVYVAQGTFQSAHRN